MTAAQTHTNANRDTKDATSLRLPHMSTRISARTTDEAGGTARAGAQRKRLSLECQAQHASEAHPAGSSKRSAAIAAAARRWPRPAACAQGTCQGRASSTGTPATTTRTTMQPVSSAAASVCKRRRQKFHFRGAYGRQGERGARAHTVVWSVAEMSRIVELVAPHEDRRARAPHPDKWATAHSQQEVGCTLRSLSKGVRYISSALSRY